MVWGTVAAVAAPATQSSNHQHRAQVRHRARLQAFSVLEERLTDTLHANVRRMDTAKLEARISALEQKLNQVPGLPELQGALLQGVLEANGMTKDSQPPARWDVAQDTRFLKLQEQVNLLAGAMDSFGKAQGILNAEVREELMSQRVAAVLVQRQRGWQATILWMFLVRTMWASVGLLITSSLTTSRTLMMRAAPRRMMKFLLALASSVRHAKARCITMVN